MLSLENAAVGDDLVDSSYSMLAIQHSSNRPIMDVISVQCFMVGLVLIIPSLMQKNMDCNISECYVSLNRLGYGGRLNGNYVVDTVHSFITSPEVPAIF